MSPSQQNDAATEPRAQPAQTSAEPYVPWYVDDQGYAQPLLF